MKAMILAAGKGERMRPLTEHTPKPLLKVAGVSLIEHHIQKLVAIGIKNIVINVSWLGQKIIDHLQDGKQLGVTIQYSIEPDSPLETAGGIKKALPLLVNDTNINASDECFLVVNGDVFTDFDFQQIFLAQEKMKQQSSKAYLWLVENPQHHPAGDFVLDNENVLNISNADDKTLTFSGIGLYRASFFKDCQQGQVAALGKLLKQAATNKILTGSKLNEFWTDVGTPQRLAEVNQQVEAIR